MPFGRVSKPRRAPRPARRSYHHGDLRRALLTTALSLVEDEDAAVLTLREVARRAGVTHSAPYHHFPTKAALLAALAEEGFRTLYTEQLQAAAKAGPDPVARLEALGIAYVKFADAHRGYFRVMFRSDAGGWADFPKVLEAAQLSYVLLAATASEAQKAGGMEVDLAEFTLAAWSVVHGLATLWVDGPLRRYPILGKDGSIAELATRIVTVSTKQLKPE
jgi:AcrR family transcriptional regulator